MKHGWYNFKTGEWIPIKCPICGNIDYDYKSYDAEFWGASVTAEQNILVQQETIHFETEKVKCDNNE